MIRYLRLNVNRRDQAFDIDDGSIFQKRERCYYEGLEKSRTIYFCFSFGWNLVQVPQGWKSLIPWI